MIRLKNEIMAVKLKHVLKTSFILSNFLFIQYTCADVIPTVDNWKSNVRGSKSCVHCPLPTAPSDRAIIILIIKQL